MYLYYDSNGTLKEIINDKALRAGNSGINKIYIYWEGASSSVLGCWSRFIDDEGKSTITRESHTTKISQVPYSRERDLKFFEYFKDYNFYVVDVPDSVLSHGGNVCGNFWFAEGQTITTMGKIAFYVEKTTLLVEPDEHISVAEWNYLVKLFDEKGYFSPTIEYNWTNNQNFNAGITTTNIKLYDGNNRVYFDVYGNDESGVKHNIGKFFFPKPLDEEGHLIEDESYVLFVTPYDYVEYVVSEKEGSISSESTDRQIPSSKVVYDYVNGLMVNSISSESTDDEIPTAKAVYDLGGGKLYMHFIYYAIWSRNESGILENRIELIINLVSKKSTKFTPDEFLEFLSSSYLKGYGYLNCYGSYQENAGTASPGPLHRGRFSVITKKEDGTFKIHVCCNKIATINDYSVIINECEYFSISTTSDDKGSVVFDSIKEII